MHGHSYKRYYLHLWSQLYLNGLVESIKMVELMDKSYKCQKMIGDTQGSVIPSSYIMMMKENCSISETVSGYTQYQSLIYQLLLDATVIAKQILFLYYINKKA